MSKPETGPNKRMSWDRMLAIGLIALIGIDILAADVN